MVDKLSVISFTLFLIADGFAVASLCMPDWIVTNVGGSTRIGLLRSCMTLRNRPTECFVQNLTPEWALSLICIFSGCLCLTTTLGLIIVTQWDRSLQQYARWFGFLAVIFFCLAAILFPIGFSINEIGGAPYQLPSNFSVGISYIFFVMSIWITVVSELFVSKICLPHF